MKAWIPWFVGALLVFGGGCEKVRKMLPGSSGSSTSKPSEGEQPATQQVEYRGNEVKAKEGTPEAVVSQMLCAAINPNEPRAFAVIRKITHSEWQYPKHFKHLRATTWPQLRKFAHRYVTDKKTCSFILVRKQQMPDGRFKIFVKDLAKKKMPTPFHIKKDADGKWKLYTMNF